MSKILYYPYIELPDETWTINSILYWDEVGTIFPNVLDNYYDDIDEMNQIFLDEGIITKVNPADFGYNQEWFNSKLLEVLKNPKFNLAEKRKSFKEDNTTICYSEKVNEEVYRGLVQLGLAKRINSDQFCVEMHAANVLIFLLASEIGRIGDYTPSTDNEHYIDKDFFSSIHQTDEYNLRNEILTEVLPTPLEVNISDLIDFKTKYSGDLNSFRKEIELIVDNLAAIDEGEIKSQLRQRSITQLNERIEYISAKMKDSKFKRIIKNTWFGVALSGLAAYLTGGVAPIITGTISTSVGVGKTVSNDQSKGHPYRYVGLLNNQYKK